MFFDPPAKDWIGIFMGAFDGSTETHTELHIFVAEKGDYYQITDGLPQYQRIPAVSEVDNDGASVKDSRQ